MATDLRQFAVPPEYAGDRLDRVLAQLVPEFSRSRLQAWLRDGHVLVDDRIRRPRDRVAGGERITLKIEPAPDDRIQPQPLAINVVWEDDAVIVVDKPSGCVVHPGAGNRSGTLQNALLHHAPQLASVPRAGIVHRLDKDTSGLMVVAKTLTAQTALVRQMRGRRVGREYIALVWGRMPSGGRVEQPIARHLRDRVRMSVQPGGRRAVTHYRVLRRFPAHTLLRVNLETGRTHQIRVHMAWLRYPIVGDPDYGRAGVFSVGADEGVRRALAGFRRQALHARRLSFTHPVTGAAVSYAAPVPSDLGALIDILGAQDNQEVG